MSRGDDQPHRGETFDRQHPGQQGKQRPVRPREPGTSPRPLTPDDSEPVAQNEDLGVLPPRLGTRQAQQRHGTGNDQEDQLQAHKPKIIPHSGRAKTAPRHAERSTALCRAFAQVALVFGTLTLSSLGSSPAPGTKGIASDGRIWRGSRSAGVSG
jgi:hypothetical protein